MRCLGGHTQNANESFNSTVWRLAPKHLHAGLKIVEIAAFLATALFNEGNSALLMLMNELELVVSSQSFNFAGNMMSSAWKDRIGAARWRPRKLGKLVKRRCKPEMIRLKQKRGCYMVLEKLINRGAVYIINYCHEFLVFATFLFKRVFLETTFFQLVGILTQKVIDQSFWKFVWIFLIQLQSIWT